MVLKILLQIFYALAAVLIAILDYFWWDKRTIEFRMGRIALYTLFFMLFVASISVTIQDHLDKEREIRVLTDRLDEITNQLTGGDSYGYIQFGFPVTSDNQILGWFTNDGDYPLYDTQIRMLDLHKFHNLQWEVPMPEEEVKKAEILMTLQTIGPHSIIELPVIRTPAELNAYGFNIWIETRYRKFVQEARFRRFGRRWSLAHRLFEQAGEDQILILEEISDKILNTYSAEEIWEFPGKPVLK